MQKNLRSKVLKAGIFLCALFLAGNIAVYFYQRHSYIETIEAWRKQDREIVLKARKYDDLQAVLKSACPLEREVKATDSDKDRILQAINEYYNNPQPATDTTASTHYYTH